MVHASVKRSLLFGIYIRYQFIPRSNGEDSGPGSHIFEKYARYCEDVLGSSCKMINVLACETHCDCMDGDNRLDKYYDPRRKPRWPPFTFGLSDLEWIAKNGTFTKLIPSARTAHIIAKYATTTDLIPSARTSHYEVGELENHTMTVSRITESDGREN
jgi:hypothetical protein